MTGARIPPHLKIAESVTADEYQRAMVQSKIVILIAVILGMAVVLLFILFGIGAFKGLIWGGGLAVFTERMLHRIFKDAHKARTHRFKHYKELKAYRERHGIEPHS